MAGTRARPPKMPTYCSWRSIRRVNDVLKQACALREKCSSHLSMPMNDEDPEVAYRIDRFVK